jgi:NitT/TauT family transport system ATP-binding protein
MPHAVEFIDTTLPDIIQLKGIRQTYKGVEKPILDGFNLLIEDKPGQGEFVVLLGISGSGKSTVLRYIAGLQEPTNGEVLIHGRPRSENGSISMVFQEYSSFPWYTVLENVALPLRIRGVGKKERYERAMEMILKVGLAGHEHKYAQAPTLSGGQLQRVAIARSLITNPSIILMDEPFGALDDVTRYEMQLLLADLWASLQSTIIFVTHDRTEAVFLGDDVYVLDPRIGKIGTHIPIDLPLSRDLVTKRSPRFMELVGQVTEALMDTARPLESS